VTSNDTVSLRVRMIDSDTFGHGHLGVNLLKMTPHNQDDETCWYDVVVAASNLAAYQAALDASDAVISWHRSLAQFGTRSPGYPGECPEGMSQSAWLAFNNVD